MFLKNLVCKLPFYLSISILLDYHKCKKVYILRPKKYAAYEGLEYNLQKDWFTVY